MCRAGSLEIVTCQQRGPIGARYIALVNKSVDPTEKSVNNCPIRLCLNISSIPVLPKPSKKSSFNINCPQSHTQGSRYNMFLVDWFYGVLASLGIWKKEAKVLFLGLDNAGKTTLLQMLKHEVLGQYQPTHHPTSEEFTIGKITLKVFDLGGHQIARRVWRDYYAKVDAVVYLVDASDWGRFEESKRELEGLLLDEALANVPFLVLGNKIDITTAASEDQLRWYFGLTNFTTGKGIVNLANSNIRPLEVFMCSIARKSGYGEGFQWITQYIK